MTATTSDRQHRVRLMLSALSPADLAEFTLHTCSTSAEAFDHLVERASAGVEFRKVFVHGPLGAARSEDLQDVFQQFGPVSSVQVVLDHQTMNAKYAFVVMETLEGTHAVLRQTVKSFNGREIFVKLAHRFDHGQGVPCVGHGGGGGLSPASSFSSLSSGMPAVSLNSASTISSPAAASAANAGGSLVPRDMPDRRKVFVRGVPVGTAEDKFRNAFVGFGTIEWARIALDRDGLQRGFGFVLFSDIASAEAAVDARQIPFDNGVLNVFKSEPKKVVIPPPAPASVALHHHHHNLQQQHHHPTHPPGAGGANMFLYHHQAMVAAAASAAARYRLHQHHLAATGTTGACMWASQANGGVPPQASSSTVPQGWYYVPASTTVVSPESLSDWEDDTTHMYSPPGGYVISTGMPPYVGRPAALQVPWMNAV